MQFFEIICGWGDFSLWFNDQSRKGNFPYASGFGPLPSMPFFDEMPVNRQDPGLHIESERGKVADWPDFLLNGNSPPSFFVSETVIDDLEANGLAIWRKTEMPIASNRCKHLDTAKAPKYFVVEAEPGIDYDFAASGVAIDESGNPVFSRQQRLNRPDLTVDLSTWSGEELFSARNLGGKLWLFCTKKVVKLAEKEKWTNLRFNRVVAAGTDPWTGK